MLNLFKKEKQKNQKTNFFKTLSIVLPALAFVVLFSSSSSFAGTVTITTPAIPEGLFDAIITALNGYITAILPFGLKVMGTLIAVGFIPRLIYKFV